MKNINIPRVKSYKVSEDGNLYNKDNIIINSHLEHKQLSRYTLQYIVCKTYNENPLNLRNIIFKDKDKANFHYTNLEFNPMKQESWDYGLANGCEFPMKYCKKCEKFKEIDLFHIAYKYRAIYCKECSSNIRSLKSIEYNKRKRERNNKDGVSKSNVYNSTFYKALKEGDINKYKEYLQKQKDWKNKNQIKYRLSTLKSRAIKANIEFNLTVDDIIIPDICPILEIPFGEEFFNRWSFDRVDCLKGYTKDNVKIISNKANTMKNNANKKELQIFVKNILKYINKE